MMKAVVFHGQQDLRTEEVEEPSPLAGQVKLQPAYVGICGTDLHIYYDPDTCGSDFSRPHPLTGGQPPQILGHEFSATVVELGDGVDEVQVGDRVTVFPVYYCGTCGPCLRGLVNQCTSVGFHGVQSVGGALATYTIVRADQCMKLPDSVNLRVGALVEPMAVCWRAVKRSGVAAGGTALVLGAGPIGIGVLLTLHEFGVRHILVSEPSDERRAAISALGATNVVNPLTADLAAWVGERTGGAGVDVIFDAAGVGPALTGSMSLLAPGGAAVIIAVHSHPVQVSPIEMLLGETSLIGTCAYVREDFASVLEAMDRGAYSTTEGWVKDVPFDRVEATFISLHGGNGVKALVDVAGATARSGA